VGGKVKQLKNWKQIAETAYQKYKGFQLRRAGDHIKKSWGNRLFELSRLFFLKGAVQITKKGN
jgi:hypothetical protein